MDGKEPPLLLLYGDQDETVKPKNIENLTKKVQELGGKVTSHRYDSLDHAGILGVLSKLLRSQYPVANDVMTFLKENS